MDGNAVSQVEIVARLMKSFAELERAINGARKSLAAKKGVSPEILSRLDSYDGILARQRELTHRLGEYVEKGDLAEVGRHVSIINALSGMIIDDARAILSALSDGAESLDAESNEVIC